MPLSFCSNMNLLLSTRTLSLFLLLGWLQGSACSKPARLRKLPVSSSSHNLPRDYHNNRKLMVALDKSNVRECSPESPCGECQGDCDTNEDCNEGLVCYQRDAAESLENAGVPGCVGISFSRTDWCVSPPEPEEPETPEDIEAGPEGFESGMATEIAGLWVGEEKYNDGGILLDYCSRALFQPSGSPNGPGYLTWHGYYLGNETETCEDMGVDPKTGSVENADYFTDLYYPEESYVLRIDYKTCLTDADCTYDVTTSEGFEDYEVVASSCGAHLKEDLLHSYYSCELYQANRIQRKDGTGDPLDVVILTYSSYTGGYSNFICPNKPTYDLEEFQDDPFAEGTARFVLQSGYGEMSNTTTWECLIE